MISTQTDLEIYPEFGNNSTKVMPDDAKYSNGFVQADVLPAEWMNWAWSKNTKGITALNKGVRSMEAELNNLVEEAGATPVESDNNQVKNAIAQLINNITGTLSNLTTSDKANLVAAINSHVGRTDNPHTVTKAQVGLGNCDNTADANKSVKASANACYFGTCSTAAATQAKVVTIGGFTLVNGARITVKFTNGNTYGTATGTASNVIAAGSCPTLNVQSTGAKKIYVGGEPAGEGFINAGDVHDFVYDGTNWCDVTADVIYKGGNDTDGYYEKKRNGQIEQTINYSGAPKTIQFPVVFSSSEYGYSIGVGRRGGYYQWRVFNTYLVDRTASQATLYTNEVDNGGGIQNGDTTCSINLHGN